MKKIIMITLSIVVLVIGVFTIYILNTNNSLTNNDKKQTSNQVELIKEDEIEVEGQENRLNEKEVHVDTTIESSNSTTKKEEVKKNDESIKSNDRNNHTTTRNTTNSNSNSSKSNQTSNNNSNSNVVENRKEVTEQPKQNTTVEPKKDNPWDKLGITEYQYYNEPQYKYEKVDFSVSKYGSESAARNACVQHGESYQPYLDGQVAYHCTTVFTWSGKYLGEWFHTEDLND